MKIKIYDHVNVRLIDNTWSCCKYVYRVFIECNEASCVHYDEIKERLEEWFGAAEYFWNDVWLCELKPGCENVEHLYNK